ncbi:MAG: GreA/GreB family elongation factor [bacterium]
MQVPKRKSEEGVYVKKDPLMTEDKLNALKKRLENLRRSHPQAASEVKRLALFGDFSENAEYQMAKGKLRGINQKILETEQEINNAIIIKPVKNATTVRIGCSVIVELNGKQAMYLILGSAESDPSKCVISHNSPIGSALMGRKAGDIVKAQLKDRMIEYKIIKIL